MQCGTRAALTDIGEYMQAEAKTEGFSELKRVFKGAGNTAPFTLQEQIASPDVFLATYADIR